MNDPILQFLKGVDESEKQFTPNSEWLYEVSLMLITMPLFILMQTPLICNSKLSSMSINILRNFVMGEWRKIVPFIYLSEKNWTTIHKKAFDIFRYNL